MPLPPEAVSLTESYKAAQARRAALIAALVVQWWRQRVNAEDASSVARWLNFVTPRILLEYGRAGTLAQVYYTQLRNIEVPNAPAFAPEPLRGLDVDRVRASLSVVGPVAVRKKLEAFDKMTAQSLLEKLALEDTQQISREMLRSAAQEEVATQIAGAAQRHVSNGGREVLADSSLKDRTALGWVRVTDADPCYFCAMLASRGLVYDRHSFDDSDPRFIGNGDAKVHDHCNCSVKPVYTRDDDYVTRSKEFEEMWYDFSTGSSAEAIRTFRQGYEGRAKVA